MPRLRYYKKYEFVDHYEHLTDEAASGFGEYERGQSWLSNNAVIATMPEAKIKEAIHYYKILIDRLQQELFLRLNGYRTGHSPGNGITYKGRQVSETAPNKTTAKSRRRTKQTGIFAGLKLTEQQRQSLQQCFDEYLNANQTTKIEEEGA